MIEVTEEMLVAAMRAFEPMSSVLRYREKDKWHTCDMMGMRDAIRAVAPLIIASVATTVEKHFERHGCGECDQDTIVTRKIREMGGIK